MSDDTPREHRLPIYTRRVHGTGALTERAHVQCPRRLRSMPLDECWMCEHVDGATYDVANTRFVLDCSPPVDAPPSDPRHARLTPVAEIMTGDVHCVTPDLEVDTVADLLLDMGISGVPVVDAEGLAIGIVTKTDIIEVMRRDLGAHARTLEQASALRKSAPPRPRRTVGEIMMPIAFTIPERASVAQAAALLAFEHVHHAPVVDGNGAVVGIVSALDVATYVARVTGYLANPAR